MPRWTQKSGRRLCRIAVGMLKTDRCKRRGQQKGRIKFAEVSTKREAETPANVGRNASETMERGRE